MSRWQDDANYYQSPFTSKFIIGNNLNSWFDWKKLLYDKTIPRFINEFSFSEIGTGPKIGYIKRPTKKFVKFVDLNEPPKAKLIADTVSEFGETALFKEIPVNKEGSYLELK